MLKTLCCLLITVSVASAQSGASLRSGAPVQAKAASSTAARQSAPAAPSSTSRADVFRKEFTALQKSVDAVAGEIPGTQILQTAKATYLEEFGIVIVIEMVLEPPRNPFGNVPSGGTLQEKQRLVREKMQQFLTQKAPSIQSLNPDQSLVVSVHIFNANPVDAPNLPAQLVFKVKKQEPSRVVVREL